VSTSCTTKARRAIESGEEEFRDAAEYLAEAQKLGANVALLSPLRSFALCRACRRQRSGVQARRRPDPANTSSRRTGSNLDLGKSSVSNRCPTPAVHVSGRTIAVQPQVLKVRLKDRLRLTAASIA
jgi:hypothetical protein